MQIQPLRFRCLAPLVLLALASCGPQRNEFAPACPVPGLVRPLAELARSRNGSPDIRDLIVRARIVDINGSCEPGSKSTLVAKAQAVVEVTRGPAMQGDGISLPVFIAVTDSGRVVDKTLFWLPVTFVRNVDAAQVATKEVRMEIPVSPQKSGAAYGIIAGFQLTPEEVAAWRRDNPRSK